MSRYKGTFSVSANYEPLVGGPFDARQLVETKADLINPKTWQQRNGDVWTYVGMMVVVSSDIEPSNNGLYILTNRDYTIASNWSKTASTEEINKLQEQINNMQAGGSVDLDTEAELPKIGDANVTYYIKENSSIQRWDKNSNNYISFGGAGEIPELEINLIYGGNSNGND